MLDGWQTPLLVWFVGLMLCCFSESCGVVIFEPGAFSSHKQNAKLTPLIPFDSAFPASRIQIRHTGRYA